MTVAVRVRRPIPDTRWRRRVGREGGREGGMGERGEGGVGGNTHENYKGKDCKCGHNN